MGPVAAIRRKMKDNGYTQADLGRLLGSRQRASEILNGTRGLTMRMAWKLYCEWGVPAEALLEPARRGRPRKGKTQNEQQL